MKVFEYEGSDAKSITLRPESDELLTTGFVEAMQTLGIKGPEVVVIVNDWSRKAPSEVPEGARDFYLGKKTAEECKSLIDTYPDCYFLMFYRPRKNLAKIENIKDTWENNHRDLVDGVCDILSQTDHDWVSISFEFPKDSTIDSHNVAEELRKSFT